jgi:hypothetical protein
MAHFWASPPTGTSPGLSDDRRITDPRGLSLSPAGDLVYVTSGDDQVVALDHDGTVVLDSGRCSARVRLAKVGPLLV